MHTIELFKSDGEWVAKFSDPGVREMVGTDTIPTPYRAAARAEVVAGSVRRKNPCARVLIRPQDAPPGFLYEPHPGADRTVLIHYIEARPPEAYSADPAAVLSGASGVEWSERYPVALYYEPGKVLIHYEPSAERARDFLARNQPLTWVDYDAWLAQLEAAGDEPNRPRIYGGMLQALEEAEARKRADREAQLAAWLETTMARCLIEIPIDGHRFEESMRNRASAAFLAGFEAGFAAQAKQQAKEGDQ